MRKGKYILIFTVMVVLAAYGMLLSFNLAPYFLTSEDLTLVLFLLLAIFLLALSYDVCRLARIGGKKEYGWDLQLPGEEIDIGPLKMKDISFYTRVQRYFKGCENETDVLSRLLVAAAKLTGTQRASILLYSGKTDELFIFRTVGWDRNEMRMLRDTRIKPGEGITGRVFLDGKALVVSDVSENDEFEAKEKYSTKAFVSAPLYAGNEIVGVINLTEKQNGAYTEKELGVLDFAVTTASLLLRDTQSVER
ncbi:MAG: GAF domain-containing protein [Spirochaetes bacterium]|nr:GAF domain-containing protein [Spirochaetota bacterium]